MKILDSIHTQYTEKAPVILTIGFFDGVHLGHQKIFSKVFNLRKEHGISYALTFKNHPQTILKPDSPLSLISTLSHRIELIEKAKIDRLILLTFDEELKRCSADEFLCSLHQHIPFDHLVLGPDAALGYQKEGDSLFLHLLSKKYSFSFHSIDPVKWGQNPVSSTRIRSLIKQGDFELTSKLLNRPYSILADIIEGEQIGRSLGFPTLNLNVQDLVLPPLGVYKVHLLYNGKAHLGLANLGVAPTIQERSQPVLEVHLLHFPENFKEPKAEIVFLNFLREEKKFHSLSELQEQIRLDIQSVQKI